MGNKGSKVSLAVAFVALTSAGCNTLNDANAYFSDKALLRGETHSVWARPTEVGYDVLDGEIVGESETTSVIYGVFYNGTASPGIGDAFIGIINAIAGRNNVSADDPAVRAAAADAVAKANGVDGIYMTQETDTGTSILWGFYAHRKVTVRGHPLRLKVIGQVSQERSDKIRELQAIGGGRNQLVFPTDLVHGIVGTH